MFRDVCSSGTKKAEKQQQSRDSRDEECPVMQGLRNPGVGGKSLKRCHLCASLGTQL